MEGRKEGTKEQMIEFELGSFLEVHTPGLEYFKAHFDIHGIL